MYLFGFEEKSPLTKRSSFLLYNSKTCNFVVCVHLCCIFGAYFCLKKKGSKSLTTNLLAFKNIFVAFSARHRKSSPKVARCGAQKSHKYCDCSFLERGWQPFWVPTRYFLLAASFQIFWPFILAIQGSSKTTPLLGAVFPW